MNFYSISVLVHFNLWGVWVEAGSKSRFRGWAKRMGFEGGEVGDVI